jgi:hypothetical protein
MPDPTDNRKQIACLPEDCGAQRHMEPSVFLTYDGMIAACMSKKDKAGNRAKPTADHEFWGRISNLANRNNRSDDTEFRNLAILEEVGWIIDKNPEKKQGRKHAGRWDTVKYKVLHHVQWAALKHDCPACRYDPDTGDQLAARSERAEKILETKDAKAAKKFFADFAAAHGLEIVRKDIENE